MSLYFRVSSGSPFRKFIKAFLSSVRSMSVYEYSEADWNLQTSSCTDDLSSLSKFDKKLRDNWDKAMSQGLFKYRLERGQLTTKVIPGRFNYVAQLNVPRSQERRKPEEINSLNQPFKAEKFNFTRIKLDEVLFELVKVPHPHHGKEVNGCLNGKDDENKEKNLIIINVSPLEYGHILIVPDVNGEKPQVLTERSIELGVETILLSKHRGFHVGFNSLCAFASVNHLHLHAYYLDYPVFVETCTVKHLHGDLYELEDAPVKAFAFQLQGSTIKQLARTIHSITNHLQQRDIAHNLHLVRGTVFGEDKSSPNTTVRLFLWPRKKNIGVKDLDAFNVAVVELAGHLPIKVAELFDGLTEENINETIRETALDDQEYQELKATVIDLCTTRQ